MYVMDYIRRHPDKHVVDNMLSPALASRLTFELGINVEFVAMVNSEVTLDCGEVECRCGKHKMMFTIKQEEDRNVQCHVKTECEHIPSTVGCISKETQLQLLDVIGKREDGVVFQSARASHIVPKCARPMMCCLYKHGVVVNTRGVLHYNYFVPPQIVNEPSMLPPFICGISRNYWTDFLVQPYRFHVAELIIGQTAIENAKALLQGLFGPENITSSTQYSDKRLLLVLSCEQTMKAFLRNSRGLQQCRFQLVFLHTSGSDYLRGKRERTKAEDAVTFSTPQIFCAHPSVDPSLCARLLGHARTLASESAFENNDAGTKAWGERVVARIQALRKSGGTRHMMRYDVEQIVCKPTRRRIGFTHVLVCNVFPEKWNALGRCVTKANVFSYLRNVHNIRLQNSAEMQNTKARPNVLHVPFEKLKL